ncbi:unnamed protein product [Gongylonema pulchrum]|uniref:Histone chaperone asf1 n=1 Tax=Gongylonema pulchrum TaxID=637853 RepID=A0A183E1C0_9BILA|nr:unnamed protein product [Gongylonema pulchrum]
MLQAMASAVNVCSVNVLDNPGQFGDPFKLEITFECYEPLADDLDWELVYVGSAESNAYDQVLDSVLVGPVGEGRHKFVFEADGPDPSKIPESEIVGVTVLLLKCRYMEQEFINIGWFVATEYTTPELQEEPPATPLLDKLQRTVCTDDVRVTTFAIKWRKGEENIVDGEVMEGENEDSVEVCGSNDQLKDEKNNLGAAGDAQDGVEEGEAVVGELARDSPNKNVSSGQPLLDVTNDSVPDLVD